MNLATWLRMAYSTSYLYSWLFGRGQGAEGVGRDLQDRHDCEYFIVIQQGVGLKEPNLPQDLPANVHVLHHPNECFDLGTVGWLLNGTVNSRREPTPPPPFPHLCAGVTQMATEGLVNAQDAHTTAGDCEDSRQAELGVPKNRQGPDAYLLSDHCCVCKTFQTMHRYMVPSRGIFLKGQCPKRIRGGDIGRGWEGPIMAIISNRP